MMGGISGPGGIQEKFDENDFSFDEIFETMVDERSIGHARTCKALADILQNKFEVSGARNDPEHAWQCKDLMKICRVYKRGGALQDKDMSLAALNGIYEMIMPLFNDPDSMEDLRPPAY